MSNHQPAIYALQRLHAELGGKIKDNRKEAAKLAGLMKQVEAVLKMLEPGFNVRQIAARRRYKVNAPFKRGQGFRLVLDILRHAEAPMTSREIAVAVLRGRGIAEPPMKAIRDMVGLVHSSLRRHQGKIVDAVGEGMPVRWVLRDGEADS